MVLDHAERRLVRAIEIQTTAPTTTGDYLVISGIDPTVGADAFSDDNRDTRKLHVN